MNPALLASLLSALMLDRLVIFTGAGLSMSEPSTVPSAAALASQCVASYLNEALPLEIPPDHIGDLERLTSYLFSNGLQTHFVRRLVDWRPFSRRPNEAHTAVADFLTAQAAHSSVTANYDSLVEKAAEELGEAIFEACLSGEEMNRVRPHRPLLKLHGSVTDRDCTLWCRCQLLQPPSNEANTRIQQRLETSKAWLRATLPEKDLLLVGFWSDWSYLSEIFADHLSAIHSAKIVLVDPASDEELRLKAPALWEWVHGDGIQFTHVPERGDTFLAFLRKEYSKALLSKVLLHAMQGYQRFAEGQPVPEIGFEHTSVNDLYLLRRDFSGVRSDRIPEKLSVDDMTGVGRVHLRLRQRGYTLDGPSYMNAEGTRIRVVNGRTNVLSQVMARHRGEPVRPIPDHFVICPGAISDGGAAPDIVRPKKAADILRSGDNSDWLTEDLASSMGVI